MFRGSLRCLKVFCRGFLRILACLTSYRSSRLTITGEIDNPDQRICQDFAKEATFWEGSGGCHGPEMSEIAWGLGFRGRFYVCVWFC